MVPTRSVDDNQRSGEERPEGQTILGIIAPPAMKSSRKSPQKNEKGLEHKQSLAGRGALQEEKTFAREN